MGMTSFCQASDGFAQVEGQSFSLLCHSTISYNILQHLTFEIGCEILSVMRSCNVIVHQGSAPLKTKLLKKLSFMAFHCPMFCYGTGGFEDNCLSYSIPTVIFSDPTLSLPSCLVIILLELLFDPTFLLVLMTHDPFPFHPSPDSILNSPASSRQRYSRFVVSRLIFRT